jgi:hypothetical protein
MLAQRTARLVGEQLKPLRLNFAQYCLWCGDRWCESPRCIEKHRRSVWIVCPSCDGTESPMDGQLFCSCVYGLEEANPAGVMDDPPLPAHQPSTTGRCSAAHVEDISACNGPRDAVSIEDASGDSALGCVHHGAVLLASLADGRVYPGPGHRDGDAIAVYYAGQSLRPFAFGHTPARVSR